MKVLIFISDSALTPLVIFFLYKVQGVCSDSLGMIIVCPCLSLSEILSWAPLDFLSPSMFPTVSTFPASCSPSWTILISLFVVLVPSWGHQQALSSIVLALNPIPKPLPSIPALSGKGLDIVGMCPLWPIVMIWLAFPFLYAYHYLITISLHFTLLTPLTYSTSLTLCPLDTLLYPLFWSCHITLSQYIMLSSCYPPIMALTATQKTISMFGMFWVVGDISCQVK